MKIHTKADWRGACDQFVEIGLALAVIESGIIHLRMTGAYTDAQAVVEMHDCLTAARKMVRAHAVTTKA